MDRIADVLNIATNAEHDDGYTTKFDGRTIVEAFANGSSHEYALVYDHMGFEGDTTVLYVRLSRRNDPAERRQSAIGRFESLKQGHAAEVKHLLPDLDILNEPERDGLLQFLQSKSSDDGNGDAVDIEMQLNEANEKIKRLEEELQSAKEQLQDRSQQNAPAPNPSADSVASGENVEAAVDRMKVQLKAQLEVITKIKYDLSKAMNAAAKTRTWLIPRALNSVLLLECMLF